MTVENARIQPRHHPRCGTSFLFVVIVVSILFSSLAFTQVEWQNLWVRIGMHLLLLVPVVGITYEFNRFVGRHDNAVTRVLSAPRACGCRISPHSSPTTPCWRWPSRP